MRATMLRDEGALRKGQAVTVLTTMRREGWCRVRADYGPRLRRWPDSPPEPSRIVPIESVEFGAVVA